MNSLLQINQLILGRKVRLGADIDDIYRNILLADNIDNLRHIVVLLLCIVEES